MLHLVSLVLVVLVAWCLLGIGAALVLGVWLRRGREAPAGSAMQRTRAPWRGIARLVLLPSLIERTARAHERRRRQG